MRKTARLYAWRILGVAVLFGILYSAAVYNALVRQVPWVIPVLACLGGACLVTGLAGLALTSKRFSAWWDRRQRGV